MDESKGIYELMNTPPVKDERKSIWDGVNLKIDSEKTILIPCGRDGMKELEKAFTEQFNKQNQL